MYDSALFMCVIRNLVLQLQGTVILLDNKTFVVVKSHFPRRPKESRELYFEM